MTSLLTSEICIRLGWMLLHSTWVLTLIGGLTWMGQRLARPSMRASYWIGMAGMCLMAAALLGWFIQAPVPGLPTGRTQPAPTEQDAGMGRSAGATESVNIPEAARSAEDSGAAQITRTGPIHPDTPRRTSPGSPEPVAAELPLAAYAAFLTPAWLAGLFVMSLRWLVGFRGTRRLLRGSRPWTASPFDVFEQLRQRLTPGKRIRLLINDAIQTPMVVGFVRATVILPTQLISQLTPDQWSAVLAHELAHVRRLDAWLNLIQLLVETVLFYHPVVWLVSRETRLARECCCDELAAKTTGLPAALAEALLEIERFRTRPAGVHEDQLKTLVAAVGDGRVSSTLLRIRLLLQPADACRWNQ